MTDQFLEALQPSPWFVVIEVLIVLGILGLIYWGYRWGARSRWPRGPFWHEISRLGRVLDYPDA